jgi:pseudouridine-5'-monophosphatase
MSETITHIIYDLDGLLLDTEPFYTKANEAVASRYGKVFNWSVKSKMIGLRAEDSAKAMIESLQLPLTVPAYLEERERLLEELFPQAEPMAGAVDLTRHLHKHGIPQAVATSSNLFYYQLKTTKHKQWFSIFQVLVTGDDPDIKRGKPAPDAFLLAAQRLQADPRHCLVFEDSPFGIEAACEAGMYAIAVPDPNMDLKHYAKAHQVLSSLNEFNPLRWNLPPYPAKRLSG